EREGLCDLVLHHGAGRLVDHALARLRPGTRSTDPHRLPALAVGDEPPHGGARCTCASALRPARRSPRPAAPAALAGCPSARGDGAIGPALPAAAGSRTTRALPGAAGT